MKVNVSLLGLVLALTVSASWASLQSQAEENVIKQQAARQSTEGEEIDWDRTIDNTDKLISTLGIIVGGIWAYIKFFRGRTFMPRLETNISASVLHENSKEYLLVKLALKNVGLSRVDIHQKGTALRLAALGGGEASRVAEAAQWTKLRAFSVFERHSWIESGETIKDEVMIVLPAAAESYVAFRLEF
jgi:hypothetical protein